MICENCGAEIRNRESYCPNCGMELLIPYSKSLKEKYMAGEYTENQNISKSYYERNPSPEIIDPRKEKIHDESEEHYDTESQEYYEEEESGPSILLVLILFLVVALLIGFVIGIMIFSGLLQSLPGF